MGPSTSTVRPLSAADRVGLTSLVAPVSFIGPSAVSTSGLAVPFASLSPPALSSSPPLPAAPSSHRILPSSQLALPRTSTRPAVGSVGAVPLVLPARPTEPVTYHHPSGLFSIGYHASGTVIQTHRPSFFPPAGSDGLFDSLRAVYGHLADHSGRVQAACADAEGWFRSITSLRLPSPPAGVLGMPPVSAMQPFLSSSSPSSPPPAQQSSVSPDQARHRRHQTQGSIQDRDRPDHSAPFYHEFAVNRASPTPSGSASTSGPPGTGQIPVWGGSSTAPTSISVASVGSDTIGPSAGVGTGAGGSTSSHHSRPSGSSRQTKPPTQAEMTFHWKLPTVPDLSAGTSGSMVGRRTASASMASGVGMAMSTPLAQHHTGSSYNTASVDGPVGRPNRAHFKRTLTEAEKVEFKRRRRLGACADCRKKKKKCTHDPEDGDGEGDVEDEDGIENVAEAVYPSVSATSNPVTQVPTQPRSDRPLAARHPNTVDYSFTGGRTGDTDFNDETTIPLETLTRTQQETICRLVGFEHRLDLSDTTGLVVVDSGIPQQPRQASTQVPAGVNSIGGIPGQHLSLFDPEFANMPGLSLDMTLPDGSLFDPDSFALFSDSEIVAGPVQSGLPSGTEAGPQSTSPVTVAPADLQLRPIPPGPTLTPSWLADQAVEEPVGRATRMSISRALDQPRMLSVCATPTSGSNPSSGMNAIPPLPVSTHRSALSQPTMGVSMQVSPPPRSVVSAVTAPTPSPVGRLNPLRSAPTNVPMITRPDGFIPAQFTRPLSVSMSVPDAPQADVPTAHAQLGSGLTATSMPQAEMFPPAQTFQPPHHFRRGARTTPASPAAAFPDTFATLPRSAGLSVASGGAWDLGGDVNGSSMGPAVEVSARGPAEPPRRSLGSSIVSRLHRLWGAVRGRDKVRTKDGATGSESRGRAVEGVGQGRRRAASASMLSPGPGSRPAGGVVASTVTGSSRMREPMVPSSSRQSERSPRAEGGDNVGAVASTLSKLSISRSARKGPR